MLAFKLLCALGAEAQRTDGVELMGRVFQGSDFCFYQSNQLPPPAFYGAFHVVCCKTTLQSEGFLGELNCRTDLLLKGSQNIFVANSSEPWIRPADNEVHRLW